MWQLGGLLQTATLSKEAGLACTIFSVTFASLREQLHCHR